MTQGKNKKTNPHNEANNTSKPSLQSTEYVDIVTLEKDFKDVFLFDEIPTTQFVSSTFKSGF